MVGYILVDKENARQAGQAVAGTTRRTFATRVLA